MKTEVKTFLSAKGEIKWFELTNANGGVVVLSNLGAGIVEVRVPDRSGKIENVALTYEEPASWFADGPCLGKTPGRFANRIANGHLVVAGKEYQLECNCGDNALHGGSDGFQNRLWDAEEVENGVRFTLVSPDGDANYPGELTATVTYIWSDDNRLRIEYTATTDAETVVNLTNHTYWNLDGADAGSILEHEMKIEADGYLEQNDKNVAQREVPVEGTPMDFRVLKPIGRDIEADFEQLKLCKGYDHTWCVRGWNPGVEMRDVVELRSAGSGRKVLISSDFPGAHVYTGNWLTGSPANRSGRDYKDYEGVAIEMQEYPDAPNNPAFPNTFLKPGEEWRRVIEFAFSAE